MREYGYFEKTSPANLAITFLGKKEKSFKLFVHIIIIIIIVFTDPVELVFTVRNLTMEEEVL